MRLLIEDYQYEAKDVADVLEGLFTLQDIDNRIAVNYVGYFYNPKIQDCVFILPKVLLDEPKGRDPDDRGYLLGKYRPADIIDLEKSEVRLEESEEKFLYDFAVWIHRAIVVFKESNRDSGIVLRRQIESEGQGKKKLSNTLLDVILALLRFNRENKSFFTFVLREIHSGFNKINWGKTISSTPAVVQGDQSVYLRPVNKKRQVNFDEELIVIFFSILHHVAERFGFRSEIPFGFKLITGSQFERYLNGYGARRLRQIKYKYFSDTAKKLWDVCYAFFDKNYQIRMASSQSEYLLVKSFHIVFEAMIEELIGDNDVPAGLKEQADGKMVDHFYTYKGLISNRIGEDNDVYYIGDSKYYKIGCHPEGEAVYKQYTYARNVIQWNLNLFLDPKNREKEKDRYRKIELRDRITEGYNVIPNFFISANIDPKTLSYDDDATREHPKQPPISRHFEHRLYDRDTLLLSHYDVNFLFVLSLYGRNNPAAKEAYRQAVRAKFRESIQKMLRDNFEFFAMQAKPGVNKEEYFKSHFQSTLGKTFRPFGNDNVFSLAIDWNDPKRDELLEQLKKDFFVGECPIGTEPTEAIASEIAKFAAAPKTVVAPDGLFMTCYIAQSEKGKRDRSDIMLFEPLLRHEGEGLTYIKRSIPSGNLNAVRYILPILAKSASGLSTVVDGYYEIEEISFHLHKKTVKENGEERNEHTPALHIRMGKFHPLEKACEVKDVKKNSNRILSFSELQGAIT